MGAAAAPILISSAIGAATNRRNPIQGALLGGVLGGFANAALPSLQGGIGNLVNGIGTNAAAGGNVGKGLAMNASLLAGSNAAGAMAAPTAASTVASTAPSAAGNYFAQAANANASTLGNLSGMSSAAPSAFPSMVPNVAQPTSSLFQNIQAAPTLGARLQGAGEGMLAFAKENPVATQVGLNAARDIMETPPPPPLQSGLLRGTPSQEQPTQYAAMGMPQINLLG